MLTVHRAERADSLVEALASIVTEPLEDPFTPEVVSVATRGIERWLTQRLSTALGTSPGREDGVCANIDFPFPGRLVGDALARASGLDDREDPWRPERSVWPLLAVVDEHLDDAWMAPLAVHLGAQGEARDEVLHTRRFATVRHIADLYDHYAVHRPAMIQAWSGGDDADGQGRRLPDDVAWQAELWRHLRRRVGTPSPAERLPDACARLRADPNLVDLPSRLSLFGLTRLATSYVEVLRALAAGREVSLFLLHPSAALWARIQDVVDGAARLPRRRTDPTATVPRHPLLTTWGRDAREMQLVVSSGGEAFHDVHHAVAHETGTLLRRIQSDVHLDVAPAGPPLPGAADERHVLAPADRSIQIHACHGRARQVEVLRDAILHLLADDPTLEPRDVIVMCPDIEAFAPLIQATFGTTELGAPAADPDAGEPTATGSRLPDLHVRLADRSLRQTNPMLALVAELLDLAAGRVTASQVVDLASREPVRRRFHFDDDDLGRLEDWVAATGIRWGLDAAHRVPYELGELGANTWRAGLDRILLGVTMAEDDLRMVGGVLPLDEVESGDIDLVGRVAELLDRVRTTVVELSEAKPIGAWADAIARAADGLGTTSEWDAWQRRELDRLLADVVDEAATDAASATTPLALPEVQSLLAGRLRGRPTTANFRTGHLTMCTLVPMRSVPHRVVCLLGLDDGVFPRRTAPDGDDVIERVPYVGDRDARSEDRQLLLDALLATLDHLVITYTGRDERTNAVRPPAVPVGELLDVVERTARCDDGNAVDQVVVRHPLQPFDVRNFTAAELVPGGPWSFDRVSLEGARASITTRQRAPAFLSAPLPPVASDLVELDQLVRFVQHPVKAFLRQRLDMALTDVEEEPSDALPIELTALEQWSVGQRLLDHRLTGADLDTCVAAEVVRGTLPPGALGQRILDDVIPVVEEIVATATKDADVDTAPESIDVNIELDDGRTLVGTVSGVVDDVVRTVTYSRIGAKQRLVSWVRLLAATAADPDRPLTAMAIGRGSRFGAGTARIDLPGTDPATRWRTALDHLAVLVDLYARGLREPLPIYCKTSAAYAAAAPAARARRARDEWQGDNRFATEDAEPEHLLVLGGQVPFDELLAVPPADGEDGAGWAGSEASRFGRLALRLWSGLLGCEERTNL
jgi:exodeoxyribonuclease V gamma subunit